MRPIQKVISRETAATERGKIIVVSLHPKFIELRLKGTRESYTLAYDAAFSAAARMNVSAGGK